MRSGATGEKQLRRAPLFDQALPRCTRDAFYRNAVCTRHDIDRPKRGRATFEERVKNA
jgi:hypothetical protein